MGNLLDENVDIASKEMLKALDAQRDQLEKINRLQDPKNLRERIRMEEELLGAQKELALEEARARRDRMLDTDALEKRIQAEQEMLQIQKEIAKAESQERQKYKNEETKQALNDIMSGNIGNILSKIAEGGSTNPVEMMLGSLMGGQGGGGQLGQVGGMIGEVMGGPIGAMIGSKIAEQIPKILAGPSQMVVKSLNLVSNSLSGLQGQLGPIGVGFDLVSGYFENLSNKIKEIPLIGEALGPMLDNLAAIPKILKDITGTLTNMAGVASPGQLEMFNMAVRDIQGAIGMSFLPVLELMRDGVRLTGEVIANFIPNWGEMRQVMSGLRYVFAEFREETRDLLQVMGPLVRGVIISSLRMLTMLLQGLATAATMAVRGLNVLLAPLADLGLVSPLRTSMGMASRPASFSGIDEYQRQLQLAAAQEPGMPTVDEMPSMVGQIRDIMVRIGEWTEVLTPDGIARAIRNSASDALPSTAAALEAAGVPTISDGMADNMANWLRENGFIP